MPPQCLDHITILHHHLKLDLITISHNHLYAQPPLTDPPLPHTHILPPPRPPTPSPTSSYHRCRFLGSRHRGPRLRHRLLTLCPPTLGPGQLFMLPMLYRWPLRDDSLITAIGPIPSKPLEVVEDEGERVLAEVSQLTEQAKRLRVRAALLRKMQI